MKLTSTINNFFNLKNKYKTQIRNSFHINSNKNSEKILLNKKPLHKYDNDYIENLYSKIQINTNKNKMIEDINKNSKNKEI